MNVLGVEDAKFVVEQVIPCFHRPRVDVLVEDELGHDVGPNVHHERGPRLASLEELGVVANLGKKRRACTVSRFGNTSILRIEILVSKR